MDQFVAQDDAQSSLPRSQQKVANLLLTEPYRLLHSPS